MSFINPEAALVKDVRGVVGQSFGSMPATLMPAVSLDGMLVMGLSWPTVIVCGGGGATEERASVLGDPSAEPQAVGWSHSA